METNEQAEGINLLSVVNTGLGLTVFTVFNPKTKFEGIVLSC